MKYYADGHGHTDLAETLGISKSESIAKNGSCNGRILRTTLKDSFANQSTLYVIGISFLTRFELPVLVGSHDFEGKWVSFTTQGNNSGSPNFDSFFPGDKIKAFAEFWDRSTVLGLEDLMEDLMYRLLSMIQSLESRGHKVVVFNTAEHTVEFFIKIPKFNLLQSRQIIDGLFWRSIPWQIEQGAAWYPEDQHYVKNCRHISPGDHGYLNSYLVDYITNHSLLENSNGDNHGY